MSKSNWKLHAVREMAESLGLKIKFVQKTFGPKHVQNRVYINGHRCQLSAEPWLTAEKEGGAELQGSQNRWATFLIVVHRSHERPGVHTGCGVHGTASESENRFYIIPKGSFAQAPGSFPARTQLAEYANAWHLLDSEPASWKDRAIRDSDARSVPICQNEERLLGQSAV